MSSNNIFSMGRDFANDVRDYQQIMKRFNDLRNVVHDPILDHDTAANLKLLPPEIRKEVLDGLYLTEKNIQKQQKRVSHVREERYKIREGRKKNKQKEAKFYGKVKDFGETSYGWMSVISTVSCGAFIFIALCSFAPGLVAGLFGKTLSGWVTTAILGGSFLGMLTSGAKKVYEVGDREKAKRGAAIDKMQREELEESIDKKTGRYSDDIKKRIVLYPDEFGPEPTSVLTYSKIK